jgi:predicted nucleic acid-binding protein
MNDLLWVDTSFLYALFVEADENHGGADMLWRESLARRREGATSILVVGELGTLLAYRFGHETAAKRVDMVLASSIVHTVYPDSPVANAAVTWWARFRDQKFSYPDCVSFEFMYRLGLRKALAFDIDYEIAGFETVRVAEQL